MHRIMDSISSKLLLRQEKTYPNCLCTWLNKLLPNAQPTPPRSSSKPSLLQLTTDKEGKLSKGMKVASLSTLTISRRVTKLMAVVSAAERTPLTKISLKLSRPIPYRIPIPRLTYVTILCTKRNTF